MSLKRFKNTGQYKTLLSLKRICLVTAVSELSCASICKDTLHNCRDDVCGDDGISYDNSRLAKCAGAKAFNKGGCTSRGRCNCPAVYRPDCDSRLSKVYECQAKCDGVSTYIYGKCSGMSGTRKNDRSSHRSTIMLDLLSNRLSNINCTA